MASVGIDLGTTFSLIGQVNAAGTPALFGDIHEASQHRTPSVLYFDESGVQVGTLAEDLQDDDPSLVLHRFIKLSLGNEDSLFTDAQGRSWTARALSALILKKIIRDATMVMTDDPTDAVIAVPANFDDRQRQHTKEAGLLAGFNSVTLIDEPVAAATFYGLDKAAQDQTLFVYDLGGGTFDATLLQASPDGLYVLGTAGSNSIGGRNIDDKLMAFLSTAFEREHGFSLLKDKVNKHQLRHLAESLKVKLSKPGRTQIRQMALLGGKPFEFAITQSQFDKLVLPLLEETVSTCQTCLEGSGLEFSDIDTFLFTGGSTMIPLVKEYVLEKTGIASHKVQHQQAHQAVAYGAAIIAGVNEGKTTEGYVPPLIQQVVPHDLCMNTFNRHTNDWVLEPIIKRNTPLPATANKTFYTTREDQTRMVFELILRRSLGDSESLGHFTFGPIERPQKNYPVEIHLDYDAQGFLKVRAYDPAAGKDVRQVFSDKKDYKAASIAYDQELVNSISVN